MENAKKKQIKRYLSWIALVALVIYLALMPIWARSDVEPEGPVASILSGTVGIGTIDTVLRGGGTLSEENGVEITIPYGVKLTRFLAGNGDRVTEGQAVAEIDRVSVMTAITGVQETLDHLLEEMQTAADAEIRDEIMAQGGGRVKLVYAEPGDDVMDVMLEHGALAVLSLDGMMAVTLKVDTAHAAGDSLTVTLSDGTQIPGWVESNLDGILTVTVEDEGYAVGETVTVDNYGTGELYIHNPWNATGWSGTVKSVKIEAEDTVSPGKTIFMLENVNGNTAYGMLRSQHQEYEELMLELFKLYQSTTIYAPCDGVVSGIEEDSVHLLADSGDGYVLTLLSNAPGEDPDAGYTNVVGTITAIVGDSWTVRINPATQDVTDYVADIGKVDTTLENMMFTLEQEPVTVYELIDGVWEIRTPAVGDTLLFALDENDCVWAVYVPTEEDVPAEPTEPGIPQEPTEPSDPTVPSEPPADPTVPETPSTNPAIPGIPNLPQFPSYGDFSGFGGYGGMVTEEPAFELYDLEQETIMEVTTQDIMTLTIRVDEKDLSKVSIGQTAEVKLPALKGQTFTATVSRISSRAENNGGSSKFSVELTLERSEKMLDGMSASATITLNTTADVLTVPLAALEEHGSKTIIYTDFDAASRALINPVTVTIGASDAENAQILSGLAAGATYYYAYYDTLELSTEVEDNGFGF